MNQQPSMTRRIQFEDLPEGGGPELPSRPLFELGMTIISIDAIEKLPQEDVENALRRHQAGDWGTLDPRGWEANQRALGRGLLIRSIYQDRNGTQFYITTDADRSITTVMLPEEC